jgi:hypothetical protein
MDAETLLLSGLFQRLPIVALLNAAVALGTVVVFAGRWPAPVLAAWLLFMLATLALRLWTWRAQRQSPADPALTPMWARQFTMGRPPPAWPGASPGCCSTPPRSGSPRSSCHSSWPAWWAARSPR